MSNARSSRQYLGVRAIQPPDLTIADRAPAATDIAFLRGQLWLDKTNEATYQFSGTSWITLGSGTVGAIVSLTGDSGGAIVPVGGNMDILGTSNEIDTAGTAGTITISLPSVLIAPGSFEATLGAITASNGNVVLGTAGNKLMSTSVASTTTAGANSFGKVTLVGGTATIATSSVTASSIILLTRHTVGATGAAALGMLSIGTVSAGVSFIINAWKTADATDLATTDVSNISWMIIN